MGRLLGQRSHHLIRRFLQQQSASHQYEQEVSKGWELGRQWKSKHYHCCSSQRISSFLLSNLHSVSSQDLGGRNLRSFHTTGPQYAAKRDFYEVLGVEKSAGSAEIKKAYYALAKQYHPDVNKGDSETEKKFQEIQHAYEVLRNDEKRSLYDQVGPERYEEAVSGTGPSSSGFEGFGDTIFEDFFAGGMEEIFGNMFGRGPASGKHVQLGLELSFMEAVRGCSKNVSYRTHVRCTTCKGVGLPPDVKPQTCKTCKGSGMVYMQKGFFSIQSTCGTCQGTGQYVKEHCRTCQGKGMVMGTKEVVVEVPPGVESGVHIKLSGEGGGGARGVRPGDLTVQIQVLDDPIFRRDGADVHVDASISMTQAILGGTVRIPTLTGDVVLKIRPGTQPSQKQVLKGKGIKVLKSRHEQYGDQYIHFRVLIPVDLNPRQRALIEEFALEETSETETTAAEGSG
ncbi:hypothetical protein O6H91_04G100200 [Diphasiastrum complanatum]|uniref:Uncharacterized protein n=3 Tax=Diphasiastrum complanatum TaxID=34168 RepID=A0ACC2DZX6_DIPCM|nr:hypothetical protein O6H91_04G100200 [Diphasiastrum complanatum]KAJ7559764.1 hypothetical protein O6H91_04G100200 [Diphasiastrum complanatum]KAJ7559765.1 hypothetical protein O6H91_04G100200 [Diphasiastrum complanatum]